MSDCHFLHGGIFWVNLGIIVCFLVGEWVCAPSRAIRSTVTYFGEPSFWRVNSKKTLYFLLSSINVMKGIYAPCRLLLPVLFVVIIPLSGIFMDLAMVQISPGPLRQQHIVCINRGQFQLELFAFIWIACISLVSL